jgi:hypothetical protein
LGCPSKSAFAQPKSLISLDASFLLDEYGAVFAVNVTSPAVQVGGSGRAAGIVNLTEE